MTRKGFVLIAVIAALCTGTWAGSISGKVSGMSGESVVYVDTIAGKTFPAPSEHPIMDQKGLLFQPHILAVQVGTTVDFLNSDKVAHNVFWTSVNQGSKKLPGKNLGTWPTGEKRPYKFDQPGVAPLLCNVHPEMAGYVVVVPTPYFATTNSQGEFEIKDVPPGNYTLKTWSEEGKPSTQSVTVSGELTSVNITVSK